MSFLKALKYIDLKKLFNNVSERKKDKKYYAILSIQYTIQDLLKRHKN